MKDAARCVVLWLVVALVACGGGAGANVGQRETLYCFKFTATNGTDRPVTDIHLPFESAPMLPSAPGAWEGRPREGGGIIFETPPPRAPGTTTEPRPQPIGPGEKLGPFVFYLRRDAGIDRIPIGQAEFSHPEGPNSPIGVEPAGDILRDSTIHCTRITFTSKDAASASQIELTSGGSSAGFIGIDGLTDGAVSVVGDRDGNMTIFRKGGQPIALPVTFNVYHRTRTQVRFRMKDGATDLGGGDVSL